MKTSNDELFSKLAQSIKDWDSLTAAQQQSWVNLAFDAWDACEAKGNPKRFVILGRFSTHGQDINLS